jgi:hypothetical protein
LASERRATSIALDKGLRDGWRERLPLALFSGPRPTLTSRRSIKAVQFAA